MHPDIGQSLEESDEHGWQIKYVFRSHFYADCLAGHIELHVRTRATIDLGRHTGC